MLPTIFFCWPHDLLIFSLPPLICTCTAVNLVNQFSYVIDIENIHHYSKNPKATLKYLKSKTGFSSLVQVSKILKCYGLPFCWFAADLEENMFISSFLTVR